MPCLEEIRRGLEAAGQTHVLRFWSELAEGERETFLQDLALLDLKALRKHCEAARAAAAASDPDPHQDRDRDQDMEPIPPQSIGSVRKSDSGALSEWEDQGSNPHHCFHFIVVLSIQIVVAVKFEPQFRLCKMYK